MEKKDPEKYCRRSAVTITKAGPGVFFLFFLISNLESKLREMRRKNWQNMDKKNPEKILSGGARRQ